MKSYKHNANSHRYNAVFMAIAIVIICILSVIFIYALNRGQSDADDVESFEGVGRFITDSDTADTDTEVITDSASSEYATSIEAEVTESAFEEAPTSITEDTSSYSETIYTETTYNDRLAQADILDIDIADTNNPYLYEYIYDCPDAVYIAKTINVEAPYCTKMEQAAVAWCILNRVDSPEFPNTVYEVVTAPNQFGYFYNTPIRDDLYELALDVLNRWRFEHLGYLDIGRVLPKEYMYFWGDLIAHNYFRINETDQWYWDWSLPNPYEVN